jgi:multidrug transporter EmrE-like cation transporter
MKNRLITATLAILVLCGGVLLIKAASGFTASKQFSLTVVPSLTITTAATLPSAMVGQSYSVTFAATGGAGTYTWTVASGSTLPAGLTLSSGGILSGNPTTAGSYSFTITVTDAVGDQSNAKVVVRK